MRAHSFVFAMFGLAEVSDLEPDAIRRELWEIAEAVLQINLKEKR